MSGYKFSLILTLIFMSLIGVLIYFASQGSVIAIVTLSVITTIVLFVIFSGMTLLIIHVTDKREHKQYIESQLMMRGELDNANRLNQLVSRQNKQLASGIKSNEIIDGETIQVDEEMFAGFGEYEE